MIKIINKIQNILLWVVFALCVIHTIICIIENRLIGVIVFGALVIIVAWLIVKLKPSDNE